MRVVMILFDSLEYDLVEKFDCKVLKQKEHGKIDLTIYFQDRPQGPGAPAKTPEVYASFLTGVIPKDYVKLYRKLDKLYTSIFKLAGIDRYGRPTALAIDVPAYCRLNKSWIDKITGFPLFVRYWKEKWPLKMSEIEYYKYMDIKASYANLIRLLGFDLIMFYFKETDKLHHAYNDYEKYEGHIRKMYRKCEDIAEQIIEAFSDKETLFIIFSDHGTNLRGGHSNHGFWSSNKPLDRGTSIDLVDWFGIIKEWYEKGADAAPAPEIEREQDEYTDEERGKIIEHLRKLGYLE